MKFKMITYECQKTRELLGLYLDNELEPTPTRETAAHLDLCASCRREFETIRAQNELLSRSIKNSDSDTQALRARIETATVGREGARFSLWENVRNRSAAVILVSGLVIVLGALLYFYVFNGITRANALYGAAAENHLACIADLSAPDWARSPTAIEELAAPVLYQNASLRSNIGNNYRLMHARICLLNGRKFLHLIYETTDGSEVSLFVARRGSSSADDSRIASGVREIELTLASNVHISSMQKDNNLLIAVANEDSESIAVLLGALI